MKHIGKYYIEDVQAVPFGEIKPAEMLSVVGENDEYKDSIQIIDRREVDFDENDEFAEADLLEILGGEEYEAVTFDRATGIYFIGFTSIDDVLSARKSAEILHELGWRTDTNTETNVDVYLAEKNVEAGKARAIKAIMQTLELSEDEPDKPDKPDAPEEDEEDEDEDDDDEQDETRRDYDYLLNMMQKRADQLAQRVNDLYACAGHQARRAAKYEARGDKKKMRECEAKMNDFYAVARHLQSAARVLGFAWIEDHFTFVCDPDF